MLADDKTSACSCLIINVRDFRVAVMYDDDMEEVKGGRGGGRLMESGNMQKEVKEG